MSTATARLKRHGGTNGGKHERTYRIWNCIKDRTRNPRHASAKNYHFKGIRMCQEWLQDYAAFRSWALSHGYRDDLQIDRIDQDGNYEPGNCQWVTPAENTRRQRRCTRAPFNGKVLTLTEIARELGVLPSTFIRRTRRLASVDKAIEISKRFPNGERLVGVNNPHARLSEDDVREIRAEHDAGQPISELAKRFKIGRSAIHKIVTKTSWRHVE